ncbi:MAG: hypothetical protein JWL59_1855 [Chthoniobacteraceae bacterium]|nr:hypothetical protein [Chthoniobacteraceae bacterium]
MTSLAVIFLFFNVVALLALPARWAPLPLLAGACYVTLGQSVDIGPFHFSVIRVLIFTGILRVLFRHERPVGGLIGVDKLMLLWGGWMLCVSVFHAAPVDALIFRMGIAYNALGTYFLIRIFCRDTQDVMHLVKITALFLAPIAIEMMYEQFTGKNLFSIFGKVDSAVIVRSGRFRAQGPFLHPILAGTIAAACIPLMIGIWNTHRFAAKVGVIACLMMVFASASSGPLVGVFFGLLALAAWRWRHRTSHMRIFAVIVYCLLALVMSKPPYFILARLDLTGSSTGWYRAELIRSTIAHFNEWWFSGTDYTRHWMATGVTNNPDHTDITSQYILNGVHGGVFLMLIFVFILWGAFSYVGKLSKRQENVDESQARFAWALGASLFAHAASCISVAYFDQSFLFLYMTLAAISSLYASTVLSGSGARESEISEPLLHGVG